MDKIIGFIGSGHMAKAMINGIINSNLVKRENILASARTKESLAYMEENYKIKTTLNNRDLVVRADYIILAVKPQMYGEILNNIKEDIQKNKVIISIAAGINMEFLESILGKDKKIIRLMPNTPAMVGEGISAVIFNENIGEVEKKQAFNIFNSFGKSQEIDEKLMDGFIALAGSSPAYVYMLIEAMADAGVMQGIPRDQAYKIGAQAVLGSAKMVLETGLHPGQLKDNVCSPGGTTIEAVVKLEEKGFRSAIMEAMKVCAEKSRNMSK